MIALLDEGSGTAAGRLLREHGLTRDGFLQALTAIRGNQRVTSAMPEGTYEALEKYGRDLVADARADRLDPVIGRDSEIRRVIQILSRKTKNNPVLIGDPGVGKTAIVEGLAQRRGDVRVCATRQSSLDMGALVAGAKYRGSLSGEGGSKRGQERRVASFSSSMSCTRWSARARPRAPWTRATCSSRCWPAASCT